MTDDINVRARRIDVRSAHAMWRAMTVEAEALRHGVQAAIGHRLRTSATVDAHFSLTVDGETASLRTRWGGAQARVVNVADRGKHRSICSASPAPATSKPAA